MMDDTQEPACTDISWIKEGITADRQERLNLRISRDTMVCVTALSTQAKGLNPHYIPGARPVFDPGPHQDRVFGRAHRKSSLPRADRSKLCRSLNRAVLERMNRKSYSIALIITPVMSMTLILPRSSLGMVRGPFLSYPCTRGSRSF